MNLRLDRICPCERQQSIRLSASEPAGLAGSLDCPAADCSRCVELEVDRLQPGGGLLGCLSCGHPELYTRKDFPPSVGISIVVVAALLVPFTPYYSSLVAAAVLDAVLYRLAPDMVVCYRCEAQHRGFPREPRHPRFDRTIEERLLYGEKAVMGSPMRPEGTAGAPEPEH